MGKRLAPYPSLGNRMMPPLPTPDPSEHRVSDHPYYKALAVKALYLMKLDCTARAPAGITSKMVDLIRLSLSSSEG